MREGIDPALITTAFEHGISVVSANKALLAQDGAALHAAAEAAGLDLRFPLTGVWLCLSQAAGFGGLDLSFMLGTCARSPSAY